MKMINLQKTKRIGKKFLVSTGLLAFLSNGLAPMAFSVSDTYYPTSKASKSASQTATLEANAVRNVLLRGDFFVTKGNQKIAVSLRDSDVQQVLRMFADKAGLNIVFHKSVSGTITLDLVNVTLNDAFAMIMQMADLTYTIDGNTLLVASSEESKKLNFTKEVMAAVPVKYVDANLIAQFLNKNIFTKGRPGLSNSEIAISNPRENEILIFGSRSDYKVAEKIIAELDKPLKITTFKVNHTTPKEMASLICDTWFKEKGTEGDELGDNSDSEIVVGGGVIACSVDSKDESQGDMESFKVQGLKVAYFPSQGVLKLYGGTSQQAADIQRFISDADKKQPQAMLEVNIVELNESDENQFTNEWQVYTKFFSGTIGGTGINSQINKTGYSYSPLFGSLFGSLNPVVWTELGSTEPTAIWQKWPDKRFIADSITWKISNSMGRIIANPKIMITSGQQSTIDFTEDYVKSIQSELTTTTAAPVKSIKYTIGNDKGLKIGLVPFISPDGYISLNIKPDYAVSAGKTGSLDADDGEVVTLLNRRNLDLKNLRIKDGETLIIGGMIREDEDKQISKAPILGDIPVIGTLFRSTSTTKVKRELVIMLTPHIIKDAEDLVESTEIEAL